MMRDLKPRLHAMPPQNWMNDANGLIWLDNWYHLFYQHNPFDSVWGHMHWGHMRSRDLLHWEHLPIALAPDLETGEEHCFSGNIILADGTPYLFYTSIGPERDTRRRAEQWLAIGSPDLSVWRRSPANPLLTAAANGRLPVLDWRDPFPWRENDRYFLVLGGELDGQGCVMIYESTDLYRWSEGRVLYQSHAYRGCECPNYFALGDPAAHSRVLLFSPNESVRAVVGACTADGLFEAGQTTVLDAGGRDAFYAANTFLDAGGERLMFGWISDRARGVLADPSLNWNGLQSFPRRLDLAGDKLLITPAAVLERLRRFVCRPQSGMQTESTTEAGGLSRQQMNWHAGEAWELHMCRPSGLPPFTLILQNADQEQTRLILDPTGCQLLLDRSRSSLSPETDHTDCRLLLETPLCDLRLYYDNSVLELFADGRACLTARVYPLAAAYTHLVLADCAGLQAGGLSAAVWNLAL